MEKNYTSVLIGLLIGLFLGYAAAQVHQIANGSSILRVSRLEIHEIRWGGNSGCSPMTPRIEATISGSGKESPEGSPESTDKTKKE